MALFRKDSRALDALFADAEGVDPTKIVEKQMTGHMHKCAIAGARRWKRRFFVLKDGFLLYYEPREKPLVFFDFHPKGVLPLDGADIVATSLTDGPKVEGARVVPGIDIAHPSFGGRSLSLAVEDEAMRNTWVAAMEASKHVTYKNAVTGSTSVDMYKDMATHAQERMGALSAQLNAAKKELKASQAALQVRNEYLLAVLAAATSAAAKNGIVIALPDPPSMPTAPEAAVTAGAGAASSGGGDEDAAGGARVRFQSGDARDGSADPPLGISLLDTEAVQTAGALAPKHGGSPGRTPAPTAGLPDSFEGHGTAEEGGAPAPAPAPAAEEEQGAAAPAAEKPAAEAPEAPAAPAAGKAVEEAAEASAIEAAPPAIPARPAAAAEPAEPAPAAGAPAEAAPAPASSGNPFA